MYGRVGVELEVVGALLAQDARRERAERLAELDLQVHRRLHRRRARVAEDAARAERARAELHAPLEPADDAAVGEQLGASRAARSSSGSIGHALGLQERLDVVVAELGPEVGRRHGVACRRAIARLCRARRTTRCSAAPTAPPASPAAGWIQIVSNGPSRRSRPLATQLSATPPARHRFFMPVVACAWRARRSIDLFGHLLHRRRQIHLALRERRLGRARRPAEQRVERARSSSSGRRSSRSSRGRGGTSRRRADRSACRR